MKVLFASFNQGKVNVYKQMVLGSNIEFVSLSEIGCTQKVEESGKDTIENAIIKAKFYHELTGMPVVANDSGLIVEKFSKEKQPGVFVRRYKNKEMSDEDMIALYEKLFNEVGGESNGVFLVALAIIDSTGKLYSKQFYYDTYFRCPPCKVRVKGLPLRSFEYDKINGRYWAEETIEEQNKSEGEDVDLQKEFILEKLLKK